ncbi:MAG: PAS domain S-box protein, partial [Methanoregula sp.]|nr:PAS domain S-box protein [Methanoregula sp.]
LKKVAAGEKSPGEVYTLVKKDQSTLRVIMFTSPIIRDGRLEGFRGSGVDISERLKLEDALSESEEKYRALAENSADIIFSLDLTGTFTYISPQVSRYGYTPGEITGKEIQQFIYPDDQAIVLKNYRQEMHDGTSISSIFRIVDKQGSLHWIEENSNLKRDEQGNPKGMVGILRDVTDRVRAEEALRESEHRFDQLAEQSSTIAWEVDTHGLYTYVNHVSETVWGYRPDELVGRMHFYDIHPESGREAFKTAAFAFFEQKEPFWNLENAIQAKDGHLVEVSTNGFPLLNSDGTLRGYRGSDSDITERKQAEDALVESEGKYRALTENTGDLLFSMDMAGIFTYISPQVNKYGFLADEIIGKTIREVIHPEDIARVEGDLSRDLEKGAQFHSTFRVFDKWGNVHWFDEKGTLRLDQSGKPMGIYGVLRDDSERRRSENALGLANKKLNLMNNITRHDILNTITGIYGCVDMAKAAHSADEREPLLNDIKDLIMIIQRQITFTREYQEVGVNLPQWQNVNYLIHKTLQNFEKSGLTFSTEFEKTEIYADPLLEKVFYNLVDNAIRYGQTITTISIHTDTSDKGLSLVFKDDGVGVEVWQKQEIFKRGVGKNTGMGLFLTAEILAITGITIEENGVFGEGARFEIRIPNGTWRFPRD